MTEPDYSNRVTMGLSRESTRDEVLAAVEAHERQISRTLDVVVPDKAGGACGYGAGRVPSRQRDVMLQRQLAAGEEDQSVPGWDQGA